MNVFELADYNDIDDIRRLRLAGFDFNSVKSWNGESVLHRACWNKRIEIIQILLKHEVNVNAIDDKGNTPLHTACTVGCNEIVEMLLKNGADVNSVNKQGVTPLHCASSYYCDTVRILLDHGANINSIDNEGNTPLHCACYHIDDSVVWVLLGYNPDPTITNNKGETPIDISYKNTSKTNNKYVKELIEQFIQETTVTKGVYE